MKKLPAPLEEFLPVIPDWVFYLLVILGASLFFYLLGKWFNKYLKPMLLPRVQRPAKEQAGDSIKVNDVIEKIQESHLESQTYRQGCFDLSKEMRSFFEMKTSLQFEEMTAGEIAEKIKSKAHVEFFRILEIMQFQSVEPGQLDFESVCTLAKQAAKKGIKTR